MLELAEIFRLLGLQYRQQFGHRMLPSHLRAMQDIEQCRTPVLGSQLYYCTQCQEQRYSYHSCKNRHRPLAWWVCCIPGPANSSHPHVHYIATGGGLTSYIFRVAIGNKRILNLQQGQVTFSYKDSATDQFKHCTVSAEEFIRKPPS